MVVQQQSGIIKGLQSVLENTLNQGRTFKDEADQFAKRNNDMFDDTGTFLGAQNSQKAQRVSRFSGSKTPTAGLVQ